MFHVGWYPTPPGVWLYPIRVARIYNETIVNARRTVTTRSGGVADRSQGRACRLSAMLHVRNREV